MTKKQKIIPPILILLFTFAAHIPLITQLGFYWDDWVMLYFKVTRGAEGFATAFDSDRPFLSYLYQLTSYLPNNPLVWQFLTVLARGTVAIAFWWLLDQIWPKQKKETTIIAILLAVYPGFKQMPIVYVWLNGLILLLAYILSFPLMLKSIETQNKKRKITLLILSLLSYTFCIVSTEYYVGLELSRGAILYLYFAEKGKFQNKTTKEKIKTVFIYWLPYIVIMGVFMIWRVFIFRFPGYQPVLLEQASNFPVKAVLDIFGRMIEDAYTASFGAWGEFIKFPNHLDFATTSGKVFWLAVVVSFVAAYTILHILQRNSSEDEKRKTKWCYQAMGLGLFMILCPGFPFWVTYLPIRLSFPFDRFLVAFMFGSCIFMVGFIFCIMKTETCANFALVGLIAFAIGGNIMNANSFRRDWDNQFNFISQLTARIPSLKAPTLLISDNNPLSFESDNSMTGMVNIAFKPGEDFDEDTLPYSVMLFSPRYQSIEHFEETDYKAFDFRGLIFNTLNENVVVYHYSPPSCLRVIDPEIHADLDIFPSNYYDFIPLSNPKEQIVSDGVSSSFIFDEVFKQQPVQNWCYWFQKAELARQMEDWNTIVEIGDKVLPTMIAADKTEYFVFAEAYMHTNQWDKAGELFGRIHHESEGSTDIVLCKYIGKWITDYPPTIDVIDGFICYMNAVGCVYNTDSFD